MGDPSKFSDLGLFYVFHSALLLMIMAELFINLYTYQKSTGKEKINKKDKGTKWMLMFNFYICIYISFYMVGNNIPAGFRNLKLPAIFSYFGVVLLLAGIVIRLWAVLTLKRAFTLSVQTAATQHLITTGIYRNVRNPAYTGSICSLLGTVICLRNVIALFIVLVLSLVCYSARIYVEEKALIEHFGEEFIDYEKHTYRLLPFVW
ncbi:phospholipid methyltransferase [Kineothrix alysoides]|uniref:Phospholipid methyltransferase n=1 Tax=Kineothrix alysoides TaxID=1469948 RepID=A0A4R1QQN7_9FIRM|nr:isoprenylcysteine carboxylmethyltransferase family protein [Kineothrix alysoides]TCL55213.1 phospholipid methyltransferase [Kineothrix alysoides]